ncbi:putative lipoprotein [Streptococcus oralis]|nr:putative lipoprotein [Streptococcus oralis]
MLSACNNRVDRDLAKTAISNIRSVVEAAGLEAEGYSTADTFGYYGSPFYVEGNTKFVDVYVDFEKDYVESTPVLKYNSRLKEVEKKKFFGFSKKTVYRLEMEYVSGDDNYDRLEEAYNILLQSGSLTSTYLSDDVIRNLYIKNSIELDSFDSNYSLVPKKEYSGNPKTRLEERDKREAILKTDVEELTPLIEDLDSSRVNNLDEETLVRNRDLLLKRVADNRSTFSIRIRIDIEQVRRQNLQVTNEDIDNWTDSDFEYLLAQILQSDKLPKNTEVRFTIKYGSKLNWETFNFNKE